MYGGIKDSRLIFNKVHVLLKQCKKNYTYFFLFVTVLLKLVTEVALSKNCSP